MMGWRNKDTKKEVPIPAPGQVPEKKAEEKEAVVSELPQVPTRRFQGDDGAVYNLVTQNEAIQEILEGVRELMKRTEE